LPAPLDQHTTHNREVSAGRFLRRCEVLDHDEPTPNADGIRAKVRAALADHVDELERGDFNEGMRRLHAELEPLRQRALALGQLA